MLLKDSSVGALVDTANGTISNAIFSHPDIYEQELEQVFARMWLFVGHESQIPNPGDFVRSRMGEEQVIVTRGRDRRINVLLNSCAHRGNMVCRYDSGNALGFQCSFHGWTYNSEGMLVNLPPGSEDLYAPDLRKEEWGLLKARVETFQGTIWANWDESAPSLMEYFGGVETYLTPPLADAEGLAGGTEVAGGIMKWRVGLNWKVPMPDNDNTHGWITHRSARGGVASFGANVGVSHSYHVWFPEGHTTDMQPPGQEPRSEFGGFAPDAPVVQEYLRERWAKRKERLGELATLNEPPHIFTQHGVRGAHDPHTAPPRARRDGDVVVHPRGQGGAPGGQGGLCALSRAALGSERHDPERRYGELVRADAVQQGPHDAHEAPPERPTAHVGAGVARSVQLRHAWYVASGSHGREHPPVLRAMGQCHGREQLGRNARRQPR